MGDDEDPFDGQFDLVMPFVVCASKGGPYDDDAFVAGYEMGLLDAVLAQAPVEVEQTVRTASMPQVDLLAMRWGYTTTTNGPDDYDDEWTTVTISRAEANQ